MAKHYSQDDINRLITGREAVPGKIYLMEDGTSYVGTYDKTIRLRTRADETVINNSSIFNNNEVVVTPLTNLQIENNLINGNNIFTYENGNLVEIKIYSDVSFQNLISTKTLTYSDDGNISKIETEIDGVIKTKKFSFNADGDLTSKTIN